MVGYVFLKFMVEGVLWTRSVCLTRSWATTGRSCTGFLNIQDDRVRAKVDREIENGLLWPEPWLALNPAFEPGGTVADLVDRGVLHPTAREIFRVRTEQDPVGREITFHRHQADAFEVANRRESYVLTTGTGSGKSMAYIVPIVDRVLREGSGKGVRAIVVYPMNALANSQRNELEKFLGKDQPQGDASPATPARRSPDEREEILQNPPDILLTNYVMLELMLTRPRERRRLITSAAEPVVPGPRRAAHLPRPAGRRRGDAGPAAAGRGRRGGAAVHRHQRHPGRPRAPRPSSAGRSPSWPPGSSARRSRRTTSSARRCAAPPTGDTDPAALAARLDVADPDQLGGAAQPTRWPSGSSRPSGCAKTTRAA